MCSYTKIYGCKNNFSSSDNCFQQGPNFIALLNGKQIFVLPENKHKRISQVSKKIRQTSCASSMDLHCYVIHFHTLGTERLACLFVCLK